MFVLNVYSLNTGLVAAMERAEKSLPYNNFTFNSQTITNTLVTYAAGSAHPWDGVIENTPFAAFNFNNSLNNVYSITAAIHALISAYDSNISVGDTGEIRAGLVQKVNGVWRQTMFTSENWVKTATKTESVGFNHIYSVLPCQVGDTWVVVHVVDTNKNRYIVLPSNQTFSVTLYQLADDN